MNKFFLIFMVVVFQSACAKEKDDKNHAPVVPSEAQRLNEARTKWTAIKPKNYKFDYEEVGFSRPVRYSIRIKDGAVVEVKSLLAPDEPISDLNAAKTVEALFLMIEQTLGSSSDRLVSVTYDSERGFPASARFSNVSEGWGFNVNNFIDENGSGL